MREPLREALSTPDRKRRYVARLFDTIADRYDLITRLLSYGRDQHWKRRLIALANVQPHERVLDLACGTGDLAFATATRSACTVGLDVTPRMVRLARARAASASAAAFAAASGAGAASATVSAAARAVSAQSRLPLQWLVGDMMSLPFASASFDVITTGYGFRNVPVLDDAIREASRVLRPGGRLFSLDFNRPQHAALRAAYLAYLTCVGSIVGFALHRDPDTYRYIPESIKRYPGAAAVVDRFRAAGFSEARWIPVLGGLMAIHIARK
jgi:ubiquinone/menaquinone biosynthesis methyltransferase